MLSFFFRKGNRVFWRFAGSYFLILLLFAVFMNFSLSYSANMLEQDILERNEKMLGQIIDISNNLYRQINHLAIASANNARLKKILNNLEAKRSDSKYEYKLLIDDLFAYDSTASDIVDSYVYIHETDMILSPDGLMHSQLYYSARLHFQDVTYAEWIAYLTGGSRYIPAREAEMQGSRRTLITFLQPVHINYLEAGRATVAVMVAQEDLNRLLEKTMGGEMSAAWIVTEDKTLLTSLGLQNLSEPDREALDSGEDLSAIRRINGRDMLVSRITSSVNGWTYITVSQRKVILEKVYALKYAMNLVMAAAMLLGVAVSAWFAYRYAGPVQKVVRMVSGQGVPSATPSKHRNELEQMKQDVSNILQETDELRSKLENQKPIVRQMYYERLFTADFERIEDAVVVGEQLGIKTDAQRYLVLIMRLFPAEDVMNPESLKQVNIASIHLKDTVQSYVGKDSLFYDLDERTMALLIYFSSKDDELCYHNTRMIADAVWNELYQRYQLHIAFYGGDLCSHLYEVGQSMEQAKYAMNLHSSAGKTHELIWYRRLSAADIQLYYPLDTENRLMNCVRAGGVEETTAALKQIYIKNAEQIKLSTVMQNQLIQQLRGSLIRLFASTGESVEMKVVHPSISSEEEFRQAFDAVTDAFQQMCILFQGKKRSRNERLKERIVEYLDASYTNPEMSLSKLSTEFQLTDGYLSHFFKEQTGVNFLPYLENLRIGKAMQLLSETDMTIQDISGAVGYSSVQAFRRAFKRINGLSPNTYRT